MRLVWDAAATVNGVSLNTNLLKGPDMLCSLPAVISKFREKSVAFGGDVREMYHQLRIRDADKSAQRFLFRFDVSHPPDVYVMDVATFGATSSPCSAQFVKNRNAEEYAGQFPEASKATLTTTTIASILRKRRFNGQKKFDSFTRRLGLKSGIGLRAPRKSCSS